MPNLNLNTCNSLFSFQSICAYDKCKPGAKMRKLHFTKSATHNKICIFYSKTVLSI